MWDARWKVVSLWLSQAARVTADNALRFFVVLDFAARGPAERNSAWYLATLLLMWPAIGLAPFNGAICNSLPKPAVLVGSAAYGLAVVAAFATVDGAWMTCWGLVAVGMAVYGPVRYAMLPAASVDARITLPRLNGLMEAGGAAAVVVGFMLALRYDGAAWGGLPAVAVLAVGLNAAALLFALPVRFPSDVYRPEPPGRAVRDFFVDARRIWAVREMRVCLLGLGLLRGLVTGLIGALLPRTLAGEGPDFGLIALLAAWVLGGMALGSLLAGLQRHPRRVLGLVPFGATGVTVGLAWLTGGGVPDATLCVIFGVMAGLVNVPLAAVYQADLPADARGNGMAVRNLADYVCVALAAAALFVLAGPLGVSPAGQLWLLAAVAALAGLYAWWFFRRPVVEQLLEFVFFVLYRFRAAGPGLDAFPLRGPVLVVANHSAWLDPLWVGKVLPRTLIPMMTSSFFDLPLLRWSMVHLAQAIRVQDANFRREVPELQEAIAALDRGECVLIFPEGAMRRREDRPLKMFGQGVWHILRERPETPVVVCWIEGGWGSYFSYYNGLPTKNKRFDFRRLIQVAVGVPHRLDPDVLADQRRTRLHLMHECGSLRGQLGLEPVKLPQEEADKGE